MFNFENLIVWRKAVDFSTVIYNLTGKFPKEEIFVLSSQFRRAADSIILNIAEGSGNSSKKEFVRFIDYAIRSGYECIGCLDIATELEYLTLKKHQELFEKLDEIIAMLVGLRKSIVNRD